MPVTLSHLWRSLWPLQPSPRTIFRSINPEKYPACGSGIVTVNSPSGSTLQCDTWLWMTCHGIRPNVRHIGLEFDHITAVDMSFCTSLRNFIEIGPPSAEKMTSCRFSRWRISAILDFRGPIMGSLKSPCTTSYMSSIDTMALNCLVFDKIAFLQFGDRQTDKQTDEQMDSFDAWSRSRCREPRLNTTVRFTRHAAVAV